MAKLTPKAAKDWVIPRSKPKNAVATAAKPMTTALTDVQTTFRKRENQSGIRRSYECDP